jgi:fructose-bisphosphate aldolase class I
VPKDFTFVHMDIQLKTCQISRLREGQGFIAALDQSGGSTPSALDRYGIARTAYTNEDEMFALVQQMRERIVTSLPFVGSKILAAILFEKTLDYQVKGRCMPSYLWEERGILSFLKIDKGLADESDGVQLMRPIPDLATLLSRGLEARVVGTKMRSVILRPEPAGIARIVEQQFQLARQIDSRGLIPILEPEVSTKLSDEDRMRAEQLLKQELARALAAVPKEVKLILKLTLPVVPNLYEPFIQHPCVLRVLALSGGFSRAVACLRLKENRGMIASFSRALLEGLRLEMTEAAFSEALSAAIDEIFFASVEKRVSP